MICHSLFRERMSLGLATFYFGTFAFGTFCGQSDEVSKCSELKDLD